MKQNSKSLYFDEFKSNFISYILMYQLDFKN